MKEKLEQYKDSNIFSLSEHYGNHYISEKDYEKIMKEYEKETYEWLKNIFEDPRLEELRKKYDFDKLYNDIKAECELKKDRCIADKNLKNKTNYPSIGCIWTMYHQINSIQFLKEEKSKYLNAPKCREISELLDTEEYSILKDNIKRVEIKYNNHCTIGPLFRTYYFDLNDDTKNWLLKRKSVLDFSDRLQDFALYKGDTLLYSTCTHEGFE